MKRWGLVLTLFTLPMSLALANCDLTHFRWDCDIPLQVRPQYHAHSLVYCGNAYGYVNQRDYERMTAYQRADVNMVLTINNEYADSPCIPYSR